MSREEVIEVLSEHLKYGSNDWEEFQEAIRCALKYLKEDYDPKILQPLYGNTK